MTEISMESGVTVVKPGRNIVASMADSFREDLKRVVEQEAVKKVTMDLTGVEMLDSVGLGLLIATHNSLSERGGSLSIRGAGEDILKLLGTMRLDKHFHIE